MRYMLVDGQGNFGSVDGDAPAAMRYTEARMSPIAGELLADIEKDTIDFQPNYDESDDEPRVLPAAFPNLLANGAQGIAVGMATSIPPHNAAELCDAALHLIEKPDAKSKALLKWVKGPDFPGGAQILGHKGIEDTYRTGRGSIKMRAVVSVEEIHGRTCLVVTELPYQVNPDRLVVSIREAVRDGKIFYALAAIKGVGREAVRALVAPARARPTLPLGRTVRQATTPTAREASVT